MLNQLQRGDEPALRPCRRSGFLRRPYFNSSGFFGEGFLVALSDPSNAPDQKRAIEFQVDTSIQSRLLNLAVRRARR
jgi:hypothetical protein